MQDIRAAAVQMESAPGDKAFNLNKIRYFSEQAVSRRVDVLAFPELCITGYWHLRRLSQKQLQALAEPIPQGPSTRRLIDLAAGFGITLGAGLLERAGDGRLYNSYVVAMPDGTTVGHRKLHCFVSPHLASGSRFTVFDTYLGCRVGVLICYDNNLIENVRITALLGAEVLLAPHQTGGCRSRSPRAMGLIDPQLWKNRERDPETLKQEFQGPKGRGWLMRWLPARAHDNGLFVLFSNGVGWDDGEIRTGNAMILDPYGEILAESQAIDDDMVAADLDASVLPSSSGRRWLEARRPELYQLLNQPGGNEKSTRSVRLGPQSDGD